MTNNHKALLRTLSVFAETIANDYHSPDVLYDLVDDIAEILSLAGAGISIAPNGQVQTLTATRSSATRLEQIQQESKQGPSIDAYQQRHAVAIENIPDFSERWPAFCVAASQESIASAAAIPVHIAGRTIGSLTLYAEQSRRWTGRRHPNRPHPRARRRRLHHPRPSLPINTHRRRFLFAAGCDGESACRRDSVISHDG